MPGLDGLRAALAESFHGHMIALAEEVRKSAKLLRDLAGRSPAHPSRAPVVANSHHLNVLLPCLSKSLRDITAHYDDKTMPRELRWRKMYHAMIKESGGLGPPQRFMIYNDFLVQLLCLLTRDRNYDPGQLDALRARILDLRQRRGIPAPPPTPPPPAAVPSPTATAGPDQLIRRASLPAPVPGNTNAVVLVPRERARAHWCEQVFALPLGSCTDMGMPERSRAFGPLADRPPPARLRTLVRRSFDGGRLRVEFVENADAEDAPWVVVRTAEDGGTGPMFGARGCHELCVRREGNALFLMRWSRSEGCAKDWVVLCFVTWEGE